MSKLHSDQLSAKYLCSTIIIIRSDLPLEGWKSHWLHWSLLNGRLPHNRKVPKSYLMLMRYKRFEVYLCDNMFTSSGHTEVTIIIIDCFSLYIIYFIIIIMYLRFKTHQCKEAASPSCSLDQSLCTHTFHPGFVGNFGSWDMLSYQHRYQFDTLHPRCPSTPVGLVGRTMLLKWARILWLAHSPLYQRPQRSASQSHSSQSGVSR